MRNKKGFSLMELMIVLIIISVLLATVNVFASSSLVKSRAINVATNLKNISTAMINSIYINYEVPENINELGRGLDVEKYGVAYIENEEEYNITVFFLGEVDFTMTKLILSSLSKTAPENLESYIFIPEGLNFEDIKDSDDVIYYNFNLVDGVISEPPLTVLGTEINEIVQNFINISEQFFSLNGYYPEQNSNHFEALGLNYEEWKDPVNFKWNGKEVKVLFDLRYNNRLRVMIKDDNRFFLGGNSRTKKIVYRYKTDEIGWYYESYNGILFEYDLLQIEDKSS